MYFLIKGSGMAGLYSIVIPEVKSSWRGTYVILGLDPGIHLEQALLSGTQAVRSAVKKNTPLKRLIGDSKWQDYKTKETQALTSALTS
jgi:hypothetical protein